MYFKVPAKPHVIYKCMSHCIDRHSIICVYKPLLTYTCYSGCWTMILVTPLQVIETSVSFGVSIPVVAILCWAMLQLSSRGPLLYAVMSSAFFSLAGLALAVLFVFANYRETLVQYSYIFFLAWKGATSLLICNLEASSYMSTAWIKTYSLITYRS